jgi:hypothetical protein
MKVGQERYLHKLRNQAHIGCEMVNPGMKMRKSGSSGNTQTGF